MRGLRAVLGSVAIGVALLWWAGAPLATPKAAADSPTPTPDRLAAPPTVVSPTQADEGAQLYWLNCQPCHGDQGQGLTDDWRAQYPPEDQNCWDSGCHGERPYENGFTLPHAVPAVIGPQALARFATAADLQAFMSQAMPFQAPGSLKPEEYWALTAFLVRAHGAPEAALPINSPEEAALIRLNPAAPAPTLAAPPASIGESGDDPAGRLRPAWAGLGVGVVLLAGLSFIAWRRRRKIRTSPPGRFASPERERHRSGEGETPVKRKFLVTQVSLRLGLYHGLLMGLALALGAWGPDAVGLSGVRLRLFYPAMLLGVLALLVVGGLGGWLAARFETALAGAVVWLAAASVATLIVGHLPYEGRGLVAWLADTRFWGLPIYPFDATARTRMLLAAFFIVLLLVMLGLLQSYRLEGVRGALHPGGRMSSRAALLLALPLPLAVGVALAADSMVNRPLRVAPQLVNEAIRTGRTYPGNLSALSRERGVNFNAIAGVRDQMSANYALTIGEIDLGTAQTVIVVADFDNGAWINCRVLADQLSHCYDASPPYLRGFPAILTGEAMDDCPACALKVSGEQRVWLLARSQRFDGRPHVMRLAQWGSHVLMRAETPDGGYAVECLFQGISPVRVERCKEIG